MVDSHWCLYCRMMLMRLLLTGASGFTGKHFSTIAVAAGYEVCPLTADLTDAKAVQHQVDMIAPDAVVHLGAISFVGHADDSAFYAVNTVGTCNLLRALTKLNRPLQRVLLASSANIYGNCTQSPISESQPPAPVNHYAMSKLAMEHMAATFFASLPIVIARPFNYTGVGQASNFLIPKLVKHFAERALVIELGNLHVEREFNDVRIVCESYLKLLEKGEAGCVYNVCRGVTYTLQDVIDMLIDMTGHNLDVCVNPAFVRANEVHTLSGNPKLLNGIYELGDEQIPAFDLRDTLSWMLAEFNG